MYPYCVMISAIHTHQTLRTPHPRQSARIDPPRGAWANGRWQNGRLVNPSLGPHASSVLRLVITGRSSHSQELYFSLLFSTFLYPIRLFGSLSSESQSTLSAQGADMAIVKNQFQSALREERTGKLIARDQVQFNRRYRDGDIPPTSTRP